ncbi:hypothetical protein [Corallococcus llansteffanensis]|uniref:Serine protease n=1 Tax=Corallococcus llansteffanensis TaxID=2316731 RepID=A0A3A8QK37_9BACT|nr:hypothetical protein [Corallococcus llansteffanensis]RKH67290.1 hypothetical protein D7V93_03205 [Corallococcus llansteffanensis]
MAGPRRHHGIQRLRSLAPSRWSAVMATARELFPQGNRFGVVAYGVGRRRVQGEPSREWTLSVYVRRKHERPEYPVPPLTFRVRGGWYSIVPDVIATGALPRSGQSALPEFEGLRIGATVNAVAPGGTLRAGGVASLLTSAGSQEPRWLLTAGHLFERNAWTTRVFAALPEGKPQVVGHPRLNLLEPSNGWPALDAALVELTPAGQALAKKTPPLKAAGVAQDGWTGTEVRMRRPTSNAWISTRTEASLFDVHFPESAFGPVSLAGLIATTSAITLDGDSGGALLTPGPAPKVLGSCSGALQPSHSFFQPLAPVLERLQQELGVQLHLWE